MDKLGATDLFDPYQCVTVAVDYLSELLDIYDGDIEKALTAYNQGSYKGVVSDYAKTVIKNSENIEKGMKQVHYSDNPLADFDAWDAEQNKWLERRPVCADCENHIQDETAFYINGEWICRDCLSAYEQEVLPE
jgi:formylmethanofuran dehydrogenase subunit E